MLPAMASGVISTGMQYAQTGQVDPWRTVTDIISGGLTGQNRSWVNAMERPVAGAVARIQSRMASVPIREAAQRAIRRSGQAPNAGGLLVLQDILEDLQRSPGETGAGGALPQETPLVFSTNVPKNGTRLRNVKNPDAPLLVVTGSKASAEHFVDTKKALKDAGYPRQQTEELVDSIYRPARARNSLGVGLSGKENVYLVMPSTSGKNIIPKIIAERLERDFKGVIVTDFAIPIHEKEAKLRTGLEKIANPSEYEIVKDLTPYQGKNIVLVDDAFTTGDSSFPLRGAIEAAGLSPVKILVLVAEEPSTPSVYQIGRGIKKVAQYAGVDPQSLVSDFEQFFTRYGAKMVNRVVFPLITGQNPVTRKKFSPEELQEYAREIIATIRARNASSRNAGGRGAVSGVR